MQNYHTHKFFSNINTAFKDSAMSYADYAKRAAELHQDVLTSVDHGTQGNWMRCWQAAKQYGLKYIHGVEAYWVRDRHEEDRTNAHIVVMARNYDGVKEINRMLSEANKSGFYYVPRVDIELLTNLNPDNVFVTTACVSFWAKLDRETREVRWHYSQDNTPDEADEIFRAFRQHFGDSIALEVQCHGTKWQKEINAHCLKLSRETGTPLIVGLDSHYIYPQQKEERKWLREESGVRMYDDDYEFDEAVYEDYPDEETVVERLRRQGVLNEQEIADAIAKTDDLVFFDDIELDTSRKLPTIYPGMAQEEKNKKYLDKVYAAWERDKAMYLAGGHPESEYLEAIRKETDIVVSTGVADYFLLDSEMIELGKKKGGIVTPTGRGSASSFFTNTLLGLSTIDRISLPVPLYPERFVTADRLKTSLPDIDINVSAQEPFVKAQEELLGKGHIFPMIAYGTLKHKSAFKLYARAKGVPAETANEVTKRIAKYELALKESDGDEDSVAIEDYVGEEYARFIDESSPYRGIVVSKSQAPCAFLLYNGDIESEIGILRINANGGKKVVYCTVCDGYTAEEFGYVKNDILIVKVVSQNAEVMKRANLPQYSSQEILSLTKNDSATWDLFAKGYTQGINQCAGTGTTDKLKLYKPRSIQDLSAFVAAIRPGFKSMVNRFLHREFFEYGVPAFDALLKNDSSGSSWMLYQENTMRCLNLAGFTMEETYPIIKAISKKKAAVIESAKERFLEGFAAYLRGSNEKKPDGEDEYAVSAERVWQIIIDSASYLFNSSHSACVSIDALYGAYLKAHYPFEYYATLLDDYAQDGNKDKVALIKAEMKRAFGIRVVPARFRQDNRTFFFDREKRQMSDALTSVKYISKSIANRLYEMRNESFDCFTDVLLCLTNDRAFNTRSIEILIRMGYFEEFGTNGKLLDVYSEFFFGENKYSKALVERSRQKRLDAIRFFESVSLPHTIPPEEQVAFEGQYFGTPISTFDVHGLYYVTGVNTSYSPKVFLYSMRTGDSGVCKIRKQVFQEKPIQPGDIVKVISHRKSPAYTFEHGQRKKKPGVTELWVDDYDIQYREEAT